MSEPNESQSFAAEEAEAISAVNEVMGEGEGGDESASPAAESGVGQPSVGAEPQSPVPQPSPALAQAQQRWEQSTATRNQLREAAAQQYQRAQQYESMLNAFLQAQREAAQQQPQPEQYAPQIDPELQRYLDQQQQNLLGQMQQMVAPAVNVAQQQQQQMEIQQQVAQEQQQWTEFGNMVTQAEQDYLSTPEGQGYNERLEGFQGAMLNALHSSGVDAPVAQKLVNEELKGVTFIAMALGQNPAYFMDNYAKSLIQWAVQQQGGPRPVNGTGNGGQRQQGRMSPQVNIARQAIGRGAVGAPPHSGGGHSNGLSAADLVDRGLTSKDIESLVKEHGSLDRAIRYLEGVGVELDQILG